MHMRVLHFIILYIDLKTHFYRLRSTTHQPKMWQYNLGDALANQKPEGGKPTDTRGSRMCAVMMEVKMAAWGSLVNEVSDCVFVSTRLPCTGTTIQPC